MTRNPDYMPPVSDAQQRAYHLLMKGARERTGKSQIEIAVELHMAQSVVSSIERSMYPGLSFLNICNILSLYQVPPCVVMETLGFEPMHQGDTNLDPAIVEIKAMYEKIPHGLQGEAVNMCKTVWAYLMRTTERDPGIDTGELKRRSSPARVAEPQTEGRLHIVREV